MNLTPNTQRTADSDQRIASSLADGYELVLADLPLIKQGVALARVGDSDYKDADYVCAVVDSSSTEDLAAWFVSLLDDTQVQRLLARKRCQAVHLEELARLEQVTSTKEKFGCIYIMYGIPREVDSQNTFCDLAGRNACFFYVGSAQTKSEAGGTKRCPFFVRHLAHQLETHKYGLKTCYPSPIKKRKTSQKSSLSNSAEADSTKKKQNRLATDRGGSQMESQGFLPS
jgi:hypothetical protein